MAAVFEYLLSIWTSHTDIYGNSTGQCWLIWEICGLDSEAQNSRWSGDDEGGAGWWWSTNSGSIRLSLETLWQAGSPEQTHEPEHPNITQVLTQFFVRNWSSGTKISEFTRCFLNASWTPDTPMGFAVQHCVCLSLQGASECTIKSPSQPWALLYEPIYISEVRKQQRCSTLFYSQAVLFKPLPASVMIDSWDLLFHFWCMTGPCHLSAWEQVCVSGLSSGQPPCFVCHKPMGGIIRPMYGQKTVMIWNKFCSDSRSLRCSHVTVCPSGTQCWHWSCPFATFPTFGMESGAHSRYYDIKRSQHREQWDSLKPACCLSATDSALSKLNGERNGWTFTLSASSQSPWLFFRTALCHLITAFKWASSPSAVKTDTSDNWQTFTVWTDFPSKVLTISYLCQTSAMSFSCFRYERTGEDEHGRRSTKLKVNLFFIYREGWKYLYSRDVPTIIIMMMIKTASQRCCPLHLLFAWTAVLFWKVPLCSTLLCQPSLYP